MRSFRWIGADMKSAKKFTLPKFSAVQSLLEKKHFSQTQWSPYFHRHLRLSFAKTFVHVEQMLALLWNNTWIARRWNACQKNCAIIGKAIKSFRWIGRGGGWCNYEKGAAESIHLGWRRVIQRRGASTRLCV